MNFRVKIGFVFFDLRQKQVKLPLLSSEDLNSKDGGTMYFLIHCGHFSNKLHFCIFSTEGVNKKPIRYWFFLDPFSTKVDFITEGVNKKTIRYWFFS